MLTGKVLREVNVDKDEIFTVTFATKLSTLFDFTLSSVAHCIYSRSPSVHHYLSLRGNNSVLAMFTFSIHAGLAANVTADQFYEAL